MASELGVQTIQHTNGTDAMTIDSSGIITLSDAGQGQFYKAGTFNPLVYDASTGGNVSSTSAEYANYVKIGKLVFIHFRFSNLSTTGLTGGNVLYVRDLPYNAIGNPSLIFWGQDINLDQYGNPVGRTATNGKWVKFDYLRDNQTDHSMVINDIENGVGDFIVTGTYMTNDNA